MSSQDKTKAQAASEKKDDELAPDESTEAAGGTAAGAETAEDRSPEEIRADIEQTREQMSDTVEALAEKTDVKSQAKQRVTEIKENVSQKRDEFTSRAKDSTPDSAAAGAQSVRTKVQENPTAVAIGAAVLVGFLLGRMARS